MTDSNSAPTDEVPWWQAALMIRGQTETDQHNLRQVWFWTGVWGFVFVAAMIALQRNPEIQGMFAWLLAALPIVVGIPTVRAYLRFLREADEFMRKVQLEGIAIGYAVGSLACLGYHILERVGAPTLPMVVALIPFATGWAVGSFVVASRHR